MAKEPEKRWAVRRADVTMFGVGLPHEQHDALRRIAFERRVAIADLVREAVSEWLARQGKRKK